MMSTSTPDREPRVRLVADVDLYVHALHGAELASAEPIEWVDTAEAEREVYGDEGYPGDEPRTFLGGPNA